MIQINRGGKIYNLDYSSVFASNISVDKILLKPNDKLYVSSKSETQLNDRVYVLGEVQRSGVVDMDGRKLTLMDALATSGGLQAVNASARSIYVIRNTADKRLDVFHLDAKNAMALALANKFALNSHDLVYVDASDLATWKRILDLIMPNATLINYGASTTRNIELIELEGW